MAPHRQRPHDAPPSSSTRDGVGIKTYRRRRPAAPIQIAQRLISLAIRSEPTGCLAPANPLSLLQGLTPPLGSASSKSQTPRVCCPWSFLDFSSSSKSPELPDKTPPSFASIVGHTDAVADSTLPIPEVRGDKIYVRISEDLYQEQLKNFRTNLIGRLLLRKGSTPLTTDAIKTSLAAIWKLTRPWRLVPLGKGFFDIHFDSEDDLKRIWKRGTCAIATGIFRLLEWKPDFKPGDAMPQTHSQVWIRISGLSQDYWHPRHLMEIASGVGTPIQIDKSTKERQFGYYARILVDMDLSQDHPSSLMVERGSHVFSVSIDYETSLAKSKHVVAKDRPKSSSYHRGHENDHTVSARNNPAQYKAKSPIVSKTVKDGVVAPMVEVGIEHSSISRTNTKELIVASPISPVFDLGNQFAILDTVATDSIVVESVVVPMVEEHIDGSSLSGHRDNCKEITMSSSDPGGLIVANNVVKAIPSLATSSHVEKTKFCWGDLENDDPLGSHSDINSADINSVNFADINSANSWYDEGDAPLDYKILQTIPKTHPKNSKSNQLQMTSLDRYPKRVRTPTVRFNI